MTSKEALNIINKNKSDEAITFFTLRWLVNTFGIKETDKKYIFTSNIKGARVDIFKHGYGQTTEQIAEIMDKAFSVHNLDIDWLECDYEEHNIDTYKNYGYEVVIIGR